MGLVLETVMQYLIGATSSQSYVLFVTQRRMPILERLTITRQSSFKKIDFGVAPEFLLKSIDLKAMKPMDLARA